MRTYKQVDFCLMDDGMMSSEELYSWANNSCMFLDDLRKTCSNLDICDG